MGDFFTGNLFDLAIYVCLFVAVVMGFMTGLLRSLATIFGYVCGLGVAMVAAPKLTSLLATFLKSAPPPTWIVLIATFVVAGMVIGALLRLVVGEMVGPKVSIPDRIAGGLLGPGPRVRPHDSTRAQARFPQGVTMAAGSVIGRAIWPAVAPTRSRGLHRSSETPAPDLTAFRTFLLKSAKPKDRHAFMRMARPRSRFLVRCQASLYGLRAGAVTFASCSHL